MVIQFPSTYDSQIQAAAAQYLPMWDWRWLKGQLYQESKLKPDAVSDAGAQGIAQFEPDTWRDVSQAMAFPASATPFDPKFAIPGAAWYMRQLRREWTAQRPETDRRALTQASYNAGLGSILKAQKLAGGASDYATIIAQLPDVTGADDAHQTTEYVRLIAHWYTLMGGADA